MPPLIADPQLKVVTMELSLTPSQNAQIDQLVHDQLNGNLAENSAWFRVSRHLLPNIAIELDIRLVRVQLWSIEVPGMPALMLRRGNTLNGFDSASGRILLVSGDQGWIVEVWMPTAARKTTHTSTAKKGKVAKKGTKGKRMYNAAAIFITEKAGHKVLSGGLPSLGKKR